MNFHSLSVKIITVLAFSTSALLVSCTKDDKDTIGNNSGAVNLPAETIGTYTGTLAYTGTDGTSIANPISGKATITKVADKLYSVTFSNNVPAINNLKFKIAAAGSYATINENGSVAGMTLDNTGLTIGVAGNGQQNWAFTGSK